MKFAHKKYKMWKYLTYMQVPSIVTQKINTLL